MEDSQLDPELEQVYMVIGNPYMRAIIRKLGEDGEVSFSELKNAVGTSTGNLYYNLDKLSGFVSKNERRKYVLTEKGLRLYRFLYENEARVKTLVAERRGIAKIVEKYILPILVPENLATYMYSQPLIPYFTLGLYVLVALLTALRGSYILFSLEQLFPPTNVMLRLSLWMIGTFTLLLLVETVSRLLGGAKKVGVDYIATILFSTLLLVIPAFIPLNDLFLINVIYRLLQVIVLGILTAAIKVYKRLPTERAFIAVFITYYASFNLSMLLQRFF